MLYIQEQIKDIMHNGVRIVKMAVGDAIVYSWTDGEVTVPCFAVVENITAYTDTTYTYTDVYDKTTDKWYKLNNLNEYEEYGVIEEVGTKWEWVEFDYDTFDKNWAITRVKVNPDCMSDDAYVNIFLSTKRGVTEAVDDEEHGYPVSNRLACKKTNCFVIRNGSGATPTSLKIFGYSQPMYFVSMSDDNNLFSSWSGGAVLFYVNKATTLDDITTYTGKLCIYNDVEYKWDGTQWVSQGSATRQGDYFISHCATTNYFYPKFYWQHSSMVIDMYIDASYPSGAICVVDFHSACPIEFTLYNNGFYFDWHAPTSTSSDSVNTGDYTKRIMATEISALPKDNSTRVLVELYSFGVNIYRYSDGALLYENYSTSLYYNWYSGLYCMSVQSNPYVKVNSYKVYGYDGTLTNDIEYKYQGGSTKQLYLYDNVTGTRYDASVDADIAYTIKNGTAEANYPTTYDTKVAPADNVTYSSLSMLKAMECPWIGMTANVGTQRYIYKSSGWEKSVAPTDCLCFTAQEAGSTIGIAQVGTSTTTKTLYYSTDESTKNEYTIGDTITLSNIGDKILFWSDADDSMGESTSIYKYFTMTGKIKASGSVMSLLNNAESITKSYAFEKLFYNCTSLTQAPVLPATNLHANCYQYMFQGCTGLTQAPVLPATEMTGCCYYGMFYNCTGLTQAPVLPATTLYDSCYSYMFYGCKGLTQAPVLPATTLYDSCYSYMFYNCTGLTQAPVLPATTLYDSCYSYMFYNCTGLTQAPVLPATEMASQCYNYMFYGCKGLTQAPELPATTLAYRCYRYMFNACTGLTQAPVLPAVELVSQCYQAMFYNCSNLTYIKAMFTTTPSTSYTNSWVRGVASSGTFVKNSEATWDVTGTSGVPSGWTVETADN